MEVRVSGPTYWDYLRLPELLDLQSGLDPSDADVSVDELHFITVHQVYEMWFKLVIRSMRLARDHLSQPRVAEEAIPYVVHHLRRVNSILDLLVRQWRVVETLAPQDFLAFRDKLVPASGFQSFQLRVIECLMGLDESQRIRYGTVEPLDHIRKLADTSPGGAVAWRTLEQARSELSILGALNLWLERTPVQGSSPGDPVDAQVVRGFVDDYLARIDASHEVQLATMVRRLGEDHRPHIEERFDAIRAAARGFLHGEDVVEDERARAARIRAAVLFIESYRDLPLLSWPRLLLDVIVELEESMILFRSGHARMVERVIGRRVGTGGSAGVDYLDKTANYRVFRDLWAIRTVLLPRDKVPPLERRDLYGFAGVPPVGAGAL
jgi:tryptophan 2,3-dioxygenase